MTLRRGFRIAEGERVVIVEDVVTTGKSTRETAAVVERLGGVVAGFASILNRSGMSNPFSAPYASLLSLNLDTYDETDCPLCASGTAIDSPGSRYSK
jgi:orotate phosphoribosyltransferase